LAKAKRGPAPFPSREAILAFVAESPTPVGKREIARAFHIRGADRIQLKRLLAGLEDDGLLARDRRRVTRPGGPPAVGVLEVTGLDADGEPVGRLMGWRGEGAAPEVRIVERPGRPLAPGDRVLARIRRGPDGRDEGRPIRRLPRAAGRVLGVYRRVRGEGRVVPTDRRAKSELGVSGADSAAAEPGELVLAEILPGRRLGLPQARIVERLGGAAAEPSSISLIAVHAHGIPETFPAEALAEAAAATPVSDLAGRTDLTALPLVTIDGADARDFDDAVWAEAEAGGRFHAVVAIADVAHYVRAQTALDAAAFARGNSVYFPDRVVPMLPERLSNDLCSLKPGADRPCLAVHLWVDAKGRLVRHRFERALMRSAARLTYEAVQRAADGRADETTAPLLETVIRPLYAVFRALHTARRRRGAIDLDLPERRVILGEDGAVAEIVPRARLDSHRLTEELMIAANVAAAETLETARAPVMYRVHDRPAPEKVMALRQFLSSLGHGLGGAARPRPGHFNALLADVAALPHAPAVNTAILRSQAQAAYAPENLGHFGLGLARYSHFTSPIRRYADLLVHRALIAALGLGEGGLAADDAERFVEWGAHLSMTERRAAAAERDAIDRYTAHFLAERVGASFAGRISGVTRFGLFVTLEETGADGLVPRRSLPGAVALDERRQELVGEGTIWRLGDAVEVRLRAAEVETGSLLFDLVAGGREARRRRPRR